jgi:hypothetical protein
MNRTALWLLVSVTFLAPALHSQNIQVDKNNRTIAITTSDKVSAEAEVARVTVGFEIYAADAASAYQQGSQLSNAILAALRRAGVADASIESSDQKITHTEFAGNDRSSEAQRAQKAFTVSQSWIVTVPATSPAAVLHVAIESGGNESGNIAWDVKDRNALQAQAAAKALERARSIATQMAAGLNTHLGSLIYASNEAPQPKFNGYKVETLSVAGEERSSIAPTVAPLAIRPQQVEETATVYAVFAIE